MPSNNKKVEKDGREGMVKEADMFGKYKSIIMDENT